MTYLRNIFFTVLLALGFSSITTTASACSLTVANMNWASANLMAEVDKFILENGFGCEVELVEGATMPTFTSMAEKGEPDVAPEFWANAALVPLQAAEAEGTIVSLNKAPITGLGEGWWIPPATLEAHPELTSAEAILARPDLFPHPEDPSKGAFVGCPAGWGCQLINAQQYKAWDMEAKGWLLVDPGSAAGLDGSMAKAVERGENWFGYYWSPTSMIGKYGMVPVDMGEWGGDDNWHNCVVKPEQECGDPKPTSWIKSEVYTIASSNFVDQAGQDGIFYLRSRTWPGPVMNSMLVYMADNQAEGSDAAIEFLLQHEDVWKEWVGADMRIKIKNAL